MNTDVEVAKQHTTANVCESCSWCETTSSGDHVPVPKRCSSYKRRWKDPRLWYADPVAEGSVYVQDFCAARRMQPPPRSFKPLSDNLELFCGPSCFDTTYSTTHGPLLLPRKYSGCKLIPVTHGPKMHYASTYADAFCRKVSPFGRRHEEWLIENTMDIRRTLREAKLRSKLSYPRHPPRPFNYRDCDPYRAAWRCTPSAWILAKEQDLKVDVEPKYHSDNAINSYTTGTSMKDTFRPDDVDARGMPCCRPELRYHPDRLQTCLECRRMIGRDHKPCPHVLYLPPDKLTMEGPYRGPRPAVKECSSYTRAYRAPQSYSFSAGDEHLPPVGDQSPAASDCLPQYDVCLRKYIH